MRGILDVEVFITRLIALCYLLAIPISPQFDMLYTGCV